MNRFFWKPLRLTLTLSWRPIEWTYFPPDPSRWTVPLIKGAKLFSQRPNFFLSGRILWPRPALLWPARNLPIIFWTLHFGFREIQCNIPCPTPAMSLLFFAMPTSNPKSSIEVTICTSSNILVWFGRDTSNKSVAGLRESLISSPFAKFAKD